MKEGTRVTAEVYGERREGTVIQPPFASTTGKIVWVVWDGTERVAWMNRMSVKAVQS